MVEQPNSNTNPFLGDSLWVCCGGDIVIARLSIYLDTFNTEALINSLGIL